MAAPRGLFTPSGLLNRFFGSAVSNAAGYAIGGAVIPVLEPLTQDIANAAWERHSVKPLNAGTAARAAALGIASQYADAAEGAQTGYNADRFAVLEALTLEPPSATALLELRRRNVISHDEFVAALGRGGMLEAWRGRFAALVQVLPSVTDMVRFAVREVFNPSQRAFLDLDAELPEAFVAAAKQLGISAELAGDYWAAHWELPSVEELAQMLFRGELNETEFSNALKALDYAPTWRGKLATILKPIPPLSDMIRFAVREVYSPELVASLGLDEGFPPEFATQAALHGMTPEYARQYWRAHWRLPSALQGYRMLWRGLITPPQLDGLLKALDYSPTWRTRLAAIAHLVPGRVDLRRMFAHDILTRAQVLEGYQKIGYTPADAEFLTQLAEADKAKGGTAESWASKAKTRLFTVAHNEFLDGSLTEEVAGEVFAAIEVPTAERPKVLELWRLEDRISRLELTAAQIKKAYGKGAWTIDEALAGLEAKGMTAEDANTFLTT